MSNLRNCTLARLATGAAFALVPTVALVGPASAAETFTINLESLNDAGVRGTTTVSVDGRDVTVKVDAEGLVPGAPHAQHLHGDTSSMDFMCPTMRDDENDDGVLTTAEGLPKYGNIFYSLTTKGDQSPDSGLAVDRFPVADEEGNLTYERTFEVTADAAAHIKNLHYVVHGIDTNDNGEYDDSAGPSELDPALPQEATAPAACGMIEGVAAGAMPHGGVETGTGPMNDGAGAPIVMGFGLALLGGAGFSAFTARRRARQES
jgi:hypothetical protein